MSIFSKLMANQYNFDGGGYVRDGLVFMFDALWNNGKNKYNPNADYIMDLVTGKKYKINDFDNKYAFENNHFTIKSLNNPVAETVANIEGECVSCEVVFYFSSTDVEELKSFMSINGINLATRVLSGNAKAFIVKSLLC